MNRPKSPLLWFGKPTQAVIMFTHGGILQCMLAALMGTERTWGM